MIGSWSFGALVDERKDRHDARSCSMTTAHTTLSEPIKTPACIVTAPSVSFSTLAKVMGPLAPEALARLLRAHKYPTGGAMRSYENARKQAIDFLVDGTPLDPNGALRPHEREVVEAMARVNPKVPEWVRAVRPNPRADVWQIHGVAVSMNADVELEGYIACGAAKFCFTKEPLARGVGSTMAALLWYYNACVLRLPLVRPGHCVIYEPRLPWVHLPSHKPERQLEKLELACSIVSAIWPTI
ncbi:hypothetical protein AKJ09_01356 [Labilithrix luteola]|uniref:Uncharacterized protein n=2 Tax=Labilithrix luteola TaxID=1391654 RepID=A0A0K1PMD8_9BACT|nr:hypothetical protein AKJ09_01356 [Labilithrix luteola]